MCSLDGSPLIDEILADHQHWSGGDARGWAGYRSHAQRVYLFARCLHAARARDGGAATADADADAKLAIVAAFHDLAVFTTVDYLALNLAAADAWLTDRGQAAWRREIGLAMTLHHRLRPYDGEAAWLVEPIRRADWIECTGGAFTAGLPRAVVRQARRRHPMGRFAAGSAAKIARHAVTHPADPLPFWRSRAALERLPRPPGG